MDVLKETEAVIYLRNVSYSKLLCETVSAKITMDHIARLLLDCQLATKLNLRYEVFVVNALQQTMTVHSLYTITCFEYP